MFSHPFIQKNEYDDLISKICRLAVDTMYHLL
jgi:hypothetical protein